MIQEHPSLGKMIAKVDLRVSATLLDAPLNTYTPIPSPVNEAVGIMIFSNDRSPLLSLEPRAVLYLESYGPAARLSHGNYGPQSTLPSNKYR